MAGLAGGLLLAGRAGQATELAPPPLAGEFARHFNLRATPLPALPVPFLGPDGEETTIEAFRGRVVLMNFWATWCAPCVVEMPALDQLQGELGPEGLQVLAVSEDRNGAAVVAPFYARHDLRRLEIYSDPKGYLAQAYGVRGLPSTFLIDAEGRIVGGMEGPADWASEEAKALIRHYLPRQEGTRT